MTMKGAMKGKEGGGGERRKQKRERSVGP